MERHRAHGLPLTVAVASIEDYQRRSEEPLAVDEDVRMFDTLGSLREIIPFDP